MLVEVLDLPTIPATPTEVPFEIAFQRLFANERELRLLTIALNELLQLGVDQCQPLRDLFAATRPLFLPEIELIFKLCLNCACLFQVLMQPPK